MLIIFYKSVMDSNIILYDPTKIKIGHSLVIRAQDVSMYVHVVAQ